MNLFLATYHDDFGRRLLNQGAPITIMDDNGSEGYQAAKAGYLDELHNALLGLPPTT